MDTETQTTSQTASGPQEQRARTVFGETFTPSEKLQQDLQNATDVLNTQVSEISDANQFVERTRADVPNLVQQAEFPSKLIAPVREAASVTHVKAAVVVREIANATVQDPSIMKNRNRVYGWIMKLRALLKDKNVSEKDKRHAQEIQEQLAEYLREAAVADANIPPEEKQAVEQTAKYWDEFVGSHISLNEYMMIVENRQKMKSLQDLVRTPDAKVSSMAFNLFSSELQELMRQHDRFVELGDVQGILGIYDALKNKLSETGSIPEDKLLIPVNEKRLNAIE